MRSSTGGASRGSRASAQPVLVVALLGVLLVVSLIASGRWGSRSVWTDGSVDASQTTYGPDTSRGSSQQRSAAMSLVSRRTKAWDKLYAEGLFHPASGYPSPAEIDPVEAEKLKTWDARVAQEWPNGCKPLEGGKKRCLPQLIIMGQFKCGTTALFDTLAQHPDLLLPHTKEANQIKCPRRQPTCVIKEVNGFNRIHSGRWDEQGILRTYDGLMPDVPVEDERMALEASPYYLSGMPDSFDDLTRFQRFSPGVKMIAIVRNPVERAFSEYVMLSERPFRRKKLGCSWGHNYSFEMLAEEEMSVRSPALMFDENKMSTCLAESTKFQPVWTLPNGTSRFQGRLLGWGEYWRFAEPWMRTMPPEQLMFVKKEDLDNPAAGPRLVSEILAWAGLRDVPLRVRKSNTAACRGSHARGAFDEERAKAIESGACDGPAEQSPQEALDPVVARRLHQHFRAANKRFAELTGLDLSNWDKSKWTDPRPAEEV